MSSVRKWVGVATVLVMAAAVPAHAVTAGGYALTDFPGSTPISIQGWSITLSGCAVAGTTTCAGSEVIPTVSNTSLGITLSLVFENIAGGPLETNLLGAGGSDIQFSAISVTAPTGLKIYESQVDVSGSDATQPIHVSVGDTLTVNGVTPSALATNLATSPTLQSETFTPFNTVTGHSDFRVGGSNFTDAGTMNTAKLTFSAVPEPVSSSLLAIGVVGLGFVRRKARRAS
jgi:hypothetical protein